MYGCVFGSYVVEHNTTNSWINRMSIEKPNPKCNERIQKLQLSVEYIADGINTWNTWPGIEGHECRGCGAEMNVLGMSYNHWCPICDPEGKHYTMQTHTRCGRMPFSNPRFGPSIDVIRAGANLAKDRKK